MSKSFISYPLGTGIIADLSTYEFPTQVRAWNEGILNLPDTGTHFGFIWEGKPAISTKAGTFILQSGMYFSIVGNAKLLGDGKGIIVTRLGYQGVFSIGGPIETFGRLNYINGCHDSLLIPPPMLGDPCLNSLYFPANIEQTQHTHPSMRVGIVDSGCGECITTDETIPLTPGVAFVIPANSLHSFRTTNNPMVVVAYHPDSDVGPTHNNNPMLNRTLVNGISANNLEEIKTRG